MLPGNGTGDAIGRSFIKKTLNNNLTLIRKKYRENHGIDYAEITAMIFQISY